MTAAEPPGIQVASVVHRLWDYNDAADMLAMARDALEQWRHARDQSAASTKAARRLAFAFSRLDSLGALEHIDRGAYK